MEYFAKALKAFCSPERPFQSLSLLDGEDSRGSEIFSRGHVEVAIAPSVEAPTYGIVRGSWPPNVIGWHSQNSFGGFSTFWKNLCLGWL